MDSYCVVSDKKEAGSKLEDIVAFPLSASQIISFDAKSYKLDRPYRPCPEGVEEVWLCVGWPNQCRETDHESRRARGIQDTMSVTLNKRDIFRGQDRFTIDPENDFDRPDHRLSGMSGGVILHLWRDGDDLVSNVEGIVIQGTIESGYVYSVSRRYLESIGRTVATLTSNRSGL